MPIITQSCILNWFCLATSLMLGFHNPWYNFRLAIWWLSSDCTITQWLPGDCLMIAWWLPGDIFDGENDKSDFDTRQLRANLLCQSLHKAAFYCGFVWCHINNWFSNFQKRLEDFCSLAFLLKYHFSGEPLIELGEPNPIFLTQSPTYSQSSHCQSSDFDWSKRP